MTHKSDNVPIFSENQIINFFSGEFPIMLVSYDFIIIGDLIFPYGSKLYLHSSDIWTREKREKKMKLKRKRGNKKGSTIMSSCGPNFTKFGMRSLKY